MPTRRKFAQILAVGLLVAVTVAACGQKPGVHAFGRGDGAEAVDGAPGTDGSGVDGAQPGDGGTVPGGDDAANGAGGAPGSGLGAGGGGGGQAAGDRTGITDSTITIGVHAPLTGAAPVQAAAFSKGKDLYWRWLHEVENETVFGRRVRVVFRDDNYTPTTAVAVCDQMATSDRAFLLIGGAGTDQINACARYAAQRSIPYLSAGVQTAGLDRYGTYFAVSMTYAQQMPLLAQLLRREHARSSLDRYSAGGLASRDGRVVVAFVRPNTPNFNDADRALEQAVRNAGFEYRTYTVVKEGNSQEAATVATQTQQAGVDVIVPITAPVFTIQLALNTGKQRYRPLYAGVGITNNLNQVMAQTCNNDEFDGALFFSPWPGWSNVMAGQYDPDFRDAANRFARDVNTLDDGGDILLAFWGIMKNLHKMLVAAGQNPSRGSFVNTLERLRITTNVFPTLRFSPNDHFGAVNAHLLLGDCDTEQFVEHPRYPGLRSSF